MQQTTEIHLLFISQRTVAALLRRRKIRDKTVSHDGGAERQKGRKQEAGFVGKTLETPWPQVSCVSLRHDWGLIFKCNSKQHKWVLSNLRNQAVEMPLCLNPYIKCPS